MRNFRKIFCILLTVCLLASSLPFAVSAATRTAATWAEFVSAVGASSSGDTVTLTADLTATSTVQISGDITVNGGKTIVRSASFADNVFVVSGALTLENVTVNGNRASTNVSDLAKELITVPAGGALTLGDGATLTTNRANCVVSGGGVTVNGGTFTMLPGSVIRDMHTYNGSASGSQNVGPAVTVNSGSFILDGGTVTENDGRVGAVSILGGTFTMNSGTISSSTANNAGSGGGGVYNAGTFTMNGGTISGCTSWLVGGGVYNAGTFNLVNGTLTGNAVALDGSTTCNGAAVYTVGTCNISGGLITANSAQNCAGGVFIDAGVCTMTGGEISGNSTSTYSGGGVFVSGSGVFNMTAGKITGNSAAQFGGAIAVTSNASRPLYVTGGEIHDNTCGSSQCGPDLYVTTTGNVAPTSLNLGCVVYTLFIDNRDNHYSATNANPAPSSNLTQNYGYVYVSNGAAHTFGDWVTTLESGCTTPGSRERTCSLCGFVEVEETEPKGHNTVINTVEPTCTADGSMTVYCPNCGYIHSESVIPALGHAPGNWKVTSPGTKARYCTRCGVLTDSASYTANDAQINITFSDPEEIGGDFAEITATVDISNNPGLWALGFYLGYEDEFEVTDVTLGSVFTDEEALIGTTDLDAADDPVASDAFAVSCKDTDDMLALCYYAENDTFTDNAANGAVLTVTFRYASDLDGTHSFVFAYDPGNVIDSDGLEADVLFVDKDLTVEPFVVCDHVAGGWVTASPATCTEDGLRTKSCTVCGRVLESEVIPALGHSAGEWVVTVPPGIAEGQRVKYCSRCGIIMATETLRPTQIINVYADDVSAEDGTSVDVDFIMENNTGIWGARFFVYYSDDISVSAFTNGAVFPTSEIETSALNFDPYANYIASGVFSAQGITEQDIRAVCVYFDPGTLSDVSANGRLFTLTFDIPEGTTGVYPIHIFCDEAVNAAEQIIPINCIAPTLTAVDCLHANSAWVEAAAPTCTGTGLRNLVCSDCGAILDTEILSALGHDFSSEWTVDIEPTATTPGEKSHHCTRCDARTDITVIEPSSPIMIGDVNGDGIVNVKDLTLFKKFIASTVTIDDIVFENCDVDGDGTVNVKDVGALKAMLASA